jgi:hypothetical protein
MATTIFILPLGSYKTGTTDVPPTSVPAASTQLTASIDVSQMSDPATSFTASFDVAIDGVSWLPWAGYHRDGGPVPHDRQGNPINLFNLGGPLPSVATASTKVRGTIDVIGPITISGTVQAI